jgi:hypothetical protein
MIREYFGMLSFCIAGLAMMLVELVAYALPASIWLKVSDVRVFDARVGEAIKMVVARTIEYDFNGKWSTSIRRLGPFGWSPYCPANGALPYQANSVLPDPLTLAWWTFPYCQLLGDGTFQMRTTWTILGDGILPDKTVTVDSNIFVIKP